MSPLSRSDSLRVAATVDLGHIMLPKGGERPSASGPPPLSFPPSKRDHPPQERSMPLPERARPLSSRHHSMISMPLPPRACPRHHHRCGGEGEVRERKGHCFLANYQHRGEVMVREKERLGREGAPLPECAL